MIKEEASNTEIWDEFWGGVGRESQQLKSRIVDEIKKITDLKGKKILEMAAGSGLTSLEFARGQARTVAIDLSQRSIELMRENSKGSSLKIVKGDIFNLPFKQGSFDIVFHQGLIEHFKDPRKVLLEQMRVLRQGGIFLIDVPQRFSTYTIMKHRLINRKRWYAGWETEYSIFDLKGLVNRLEPYNLRLISSFGYGTWGILTRIRYLHYRGNVHFGHPVLPKPIFSIYEFIWRIIENSFIMKLIGVNICIVGLKK